MGFDWLVSEFTELSLTIQMAFGTCMEVCKYVFGSGSSKEKNEDPKSSSR